VPSEFILFPTLKSAQNKLQEVPDTLVEQHSGRGLTEVLQNVAGTQEIFCRVMETLLSTQ